MRGLDDYEKALWNWVNVYNLDAFLQEVYSYYEGKGIYCIALSRGLNLLSVNFVLLFTHSTKLGLVERLALLLGFLLSYWGVSTTPVSVNTNTLGFQMLLFIVVSLGMSSYIMLSSSSYAKIDFRDLHCCSSCYLPPSIFGK